MKNNLCLHERTIKTFQRLDKEETISAEIDPAGGEDVWTIQLPFWRPSAANHTPRIVAYGSDLETLLLFLEAAVEQGLLKRRLGQ